MPPRCMLRSHHKKRPREGVFNHLRVQTPLQTFLQTKGTKHTLNKHHKERETWAKTKTCSDYTTHVIIKKNDRYFLSRYGLTKEEFIELKNRPLEFPGGLSAEEQALITKIRESVELTPDTVISKVIDTGTLLKYLNGTYTEIGGFVARAQDVVDLQTPRDFQWELRLDYNHPSSQYYNPKYPNPFLRPDGTFRNAPVAIIRFEAKNTKYFSIPYEFNDVEYLQQRHPYTGTGFSGGDKIIPEYIMERAPIPVGIEIFIRDTDGAEKLFAVYLGGGTWKIR
jgi:hypothetical protein